MPKHHTAASTFTTNFASFAYTGFRLHACFTAYLLD